MREVNKDHDQAREPRKVIRCSVGGLEAWTRRTLGVHQGEATACFLYTGCRRQWQAIYGARHTRLPASVLCPSFSQISSSYPIICITPWPRRYPSNSSMGRAKGYVSRSHKDQLVHQERNKAARRHNGPLVSNYVDARQAVRLYQAQMDKVALAPRGFGPVIGSCSVIGNPAQPLLPAADAEALRHPVPLLLTWPLFSSHCWSHPSNLEFVT